MSAGSDRLAATGIHADERGQVADPERLFNALGNAVRRRILTSVANHGKDVTALAQELHLHPATVRYHLTYLRAEGLLDEVAGPREGAGRPPTLYRASRHVVLPSFPPRHFDLLAEMALDALANAAEREGASQYLHEKGRETGRSMITALASREGLQRWTPDEFERLVLGGLYPEYGIPTEVLAKSPDAIAYRAFNCPFLELAEKMPSAVCDALDRGFHEGIGEAIGDAHTTRVACMGHGDPYCEYRVAWPRAPDPLVVRTPATKKRRRRG